MLSIHYLLVAFVVRSTRINKTLIYLASHHPHDLVLLYTQCYPNRTVAADLADRHRIKYDFELNDDDLL